MERTRCARAEPGLQIAVHGWPPQRKITRRKVEGWTEANLIAASCAAPPEGRSRWTLKLLGDHVVALGLVDGDGQFSGTGDYCVSPSRITGTPQEHRIELVTQFKELDIRAHAPAGRQWGGPDHACYLPHLPAKWLGKHGEIEVFMVDEVRTRTLRRSARFGNHPSPPASCHRARDPRTTQKVIIPVLS